MYHLARDPLGHGLRRTDFGLPQQKATPRQIPCQIRSLAPSNLGQSGGFWEKYLALLGRYGLDPHAEGGLVRLAAWFIESVQGRRRLRIGRLTGPVILLAAVSRMRKMIINWRWGGCCSSAWRRQCSKRRLALPVMMSCLLMGVGVATQLFDSPCRWGRNRNELLVLHQGCLASGDPQDGVIGLVGGEGQCRRDIRGFQVGKVFQNLRLGGAGGEHLQEVGHPDP